MEFYAIDIHAVEHLLQSRRAKCDRWPGEQRHELSVSASEGWGNNFLSNMRARCQRDDANRSLRLFLPMSGLWSHTQTEARRLLCILFVRGSKLSIAARRGLSFKISVPRPILTGENWEDFWRLPHWYYFWRSRLGCWWMCCHKFRTRVVCPDFVIGVSQIAVGLIFRPRNVGYHVHIRDGSYDERDDKQPQNNFHDPGCDIGTWHSTRFRFAWSSRPSQY
jgi:hypothetical protein